MPGPSRGNLQIYDDICNILFNYFILYSLNKTHIYDFHLLYLIKKDVRSALVYQNALLSTEIQEIFALADSRQLSQTVQVHITISQKKKMMHHLRLCVIFLEDSFHSLAFEYS